MNKKPLGKCDRCDKFVPMGELREVEITDYKYEDISYDYLTICPNCHRKLVDWFLIKE
ncbi:MAG: hypothetical protein KBT27_12890 [Prevotellaceae bacterium]|nr:hypothetical protein [Candidatus Faecinaster equi]